MGISSNLPTIFFSLFLFPCIFFCFSQAATFEIRNQCSYTVWAAAFPGGGKKLKSDETWVINMAANTTLGRIWGRTNCTFDATGNGSCETGDCNNQLECKDNGASPITLAEFSPNQSSHLDFYHLSLINGFNIPMEYSPNNSSCREIRCAADIKGECPVELRAPGGCNHPCIVFRTHLYCCQDSASNCTATYLSNFFKTKCPDTYSFSYDDQTSSFTCPTGSNYRVVFCPSVSSPPPYSSFGHMCIRLAYV